MHHTLTGAGGGGGPCSAANSGLILVSAGFSCCTYTPASPCLLSLFEYFCSRFSFFRTLYLEGERKLDFAGWCAAIQVAGGCGGDTLSQQQLTETDIPIIVHSCISYITQCGETHMLFPPSHDVTHTHANLASLLGVCVSHVFVIAGILLLRLQDSKITPPPPTHLHFCRCSLLTAFVFCPFPRSPFFLPPSPADLPSLTQTSSLSLPPFSTSHSHIPSLC